MAMELNAVGDGPTRNSQEWKQVFREWKGAVRKRARENKELNQLEQTLLDLTGTLAVARLELQEIGVDIENGDQEFDVDLGGGEADAVEKAAAIEEEMSENALDEATQPENEVFVIQVEDPLNKHKSKRRTQKNTLLTAYENGQKSEREGLSEIAKALQNVAIGINGFCDLYETIHQSS